MFGTVRRAHAIPRGNGAARGIHARGAGRAGESVRSGARAHFRTRRIPLLHRAIRRERSKFMDQGAGAVHVMENVLIIGGNAAGLTAASRAKRLDSRLNVTVLEKGPTISYSTCGIPYFLAKIV